MKKLPHMIAIGWPKCIFTADGLFDKQALSRLGDADAIVEVLSEKLRSDGFNVLGGWAIYYDENSPDKPSIAEIEARVDELTVALNEQTKSRDAGKSLLRQFGGEDGLLEKLRTNPQEVIDAVKG